MAVENLAELLTGKALGIPKERLDIQGWVAAFRSYKSAVPHERLTMEISLAQAISESDDWAFIADAINVARALRIEHLLIRAAIVSAEWMKKPRQYAELISIEVRRYFRDVPQPQTAPSEVLDWQTMDTAEVGRSSEVYLSKRLGLDTGESLLMKYPRQTELVAA